MKWFKRADMGREINRPLRVACLSTLWFSTIPLLLGLPPLVTLILLALPGVGGFLATLRPLSKTVRFGLMFATLMGILAVQTGVGDIRTTAIALSMMAIVMKGTEIRTTRDGYSIVGFALIGPFVAFVMEMGGGLTIAVSVAVLLMTLSLAGMLSEWQDNLPVRRLRQHAKGVLVLGALALPLAAVGFWAIPRLDAPLWGLPSGSQSKTGIGNTMSPGDIASLMEDPSTAFRVDFDGPTPPSRLLYWRGLTLSAFDGRTWGEQGFFVDPATGQLPLPGIEPSSQPPIRYSMSMEPSEQPYLFSLDHLVSPAPARTNRLPDARLVSQTPVRRLLRLENLESDPQARFQTAGLSLLERERYTALPEAFNPKTVALGRSWRTRGLGEREIIDEALGMYRREFRYSLQPALLGRNSMDEFLFETKVGFCEHYSSSFAILMRAAGIPTRVVIGYQGGILNDFGGYWRVRQADAHAWNEVWLQGEGWVRVDPTGALQSDRTLSAGQRSSALREFGGNGALLDWVRQSWGTWVDRFDADRQRDLLRMVGLEGVSPVLVGTLAFVALGFGLWLIARLMVRERKQEPAALRAWKKHVQRLENKGHAAPRHEPPLVFAHRVAQSIPKEDGSALVATAEALCQWLYGQEAEGDLAHRIRQLKAPRPNRTSE